MTETLEKSVALHAIANEAASGRLIFPTSVEMALRIQKTLEEPDCTVETAARLIRAEPLLSARIVALANSVAYSRSPHPITDVRVAVTRLGFRIVRILATAVITRQMAGLQMAPAHKAMANRLWEHTAHVSALAHVLARKVTHQDAETAMFAGIVHEVSGFYLLSRAQEYPGLMEEDLTDWAGEDQGEGVLGRAVFKALSVPEKVVTAVEVLWQGYLTLPPASLGDTLLLADILAPVKSPLYQRPDRSGDGTATNIDMVLDQETLLSILSESAQEVASLTTALQF